MIHSVSDWKSTIEPRHDIDPEEKHKKEAYSLDMAQYIYSQFNSNQCYPMRSTYKSFSLNRAYAAGEQPSEMYIERVNGLDATGKIKREGWRNANFEDVLSPMPKYMRKYVGWFMNQEHRVAVTGIDSYSKMKRDDKKFETKAKMMLGIPPQEGEIVPENDVELKLFESIIGTRLMYEIAAEKALTHTDEISENKRVKEKVIYDWGSIGVSFEHDYIDPYTGKAVYEYLDPDKTFMEFSKDHDFDLATFACFERYVTIADIKRKHPNMPEDEIRGYAMKFLNSYGNPEYYNQVDDAENGVFGYYSFKVPELVCYWLSMDTYYSPTAYKEVGGFRIPVNNPRENEIKSGKVKPKNTVIKQREMLYQCSWIPGTKVVSDFGLSHYIPRQKGVRLPIHGVKIKGKPIVEGCRIPLDNIQLAQLRFQNECAKARPNNSLGMNIAALKNVVGKIEGVKTEADVVAFLAENGIGLFSHEGTMPTHVPGSNSGAGAGYPYFPIAGGLGNAVGEFIQTINIAEQQLATITGVDQFSALQATPSSETSGAAMQAAMSATNETFRPFSVAYSNLRQRVAENCLSRITNICVHTPINKNPYRGVLTDEMINALSEVGMENTAAWYGISIEDKPGAEMIQRFDRMVEASIAKGTTTASDWVIISQIFQNKGNIKEAGLYLAYCEEKKAKQDAAKQQQVITLQGEEQRKTQAMQAELDMKKDTHATNEAIRKAGAEAIFAKGLNEAQANLQLMNQLLTGAAQQGMQAAQQGQEQQMQMAMQQGMGGNMPEEQEEAEEMED